MGRALRHPLPRNRVRIVYDDGLAAFDLPPGATLADLAKRLEKAGKGRKALSVKVAVGSRCLPI